MGDVTGFLKYERQLPHRRPVPVRLRDWKEVYEPFPAEAARHQGARCMDCGIPFCHEGCPLGNLIPEWNDLVFRDDWSEAIERLHATNNFPEFTGRLCPAPCEGACVLGINDEPVAIERVEYEIAERAWSEGWVGAQPAEREHRQAGGRGGVGSGRAGRRPAAGPGRTPCRGVRTGGEARRAASLRHPRVQDGEGGGGPAHRPAGGRRGGVPVWHLGGPARPRGGLGRGPRGHGGRRPEPWWRSSTASCWPAGPPCPGTCPSPAGTWEGSTAPWTISSRPTWSRRAASTSRPSTRRGKHVVIIGGGDTGADCLGTVHRQGALSVHQLEIMPEPPGDRNEDNPWPTWPLILRTSSALEEGGERLFSVTTVEFLDDGSGHVRALRGEEVEVVYGDDGRPDFRAVPGSEFELPCELVLLAMGFLGTERGGVVEELGLEVNQRGSVVADDAWATNVDGVFVCGDMTRGQSLIVWAIAEGRSAAAAVDRYLMGHTALPAPICPGQVALR